MKVKGVVGVIGVVRVAVLRLVPADDLAHVLDQGLAFGQVLQRKNAFAMDAGAANLDAFTGRPQQVCRWSGWRGKQVFWPRR
jgi:hypothetical protein